MVLSWLMPDFRVRAAPRPGDARLNGIALQRHERGIDAVSAAGPELRAGINGQLQRQVTISSATFGFWSACLFRPPLAR